VLLRHLFAIAVLPFTVAVLVPVWLARQMTGPVGIGSGLALQGQIVGVAVGCAGLLLFVASLRRFVLNGRGTLAPWDPPRHLVVQGPYRYVRNPMISGVCLVLVAEALILRSPSHGRWAGIFFVVNSIYIPLLEEPLLRARFGGAYLDYARHVPRLIPRARPWSPPAIPPQQAPDASDNG